MCLYIDTKKTEQFKKSAIKTPNKKIPIIKEIIIDKGKVRTPHQLVKLKAGWLEAEKVASEYQTCDSVYGGAIHAYRANKIVLNKCVCSPCRYIKCFAYAKDFIAYGKHNDICFKRIYIPIEEYERIAKKEGIEL